QQLVCDLSRGASKRRPAARDASLAERVTYFERTTIQFTSRGWSGTPRHGRHARRFCCTFPTFRQGRSFRAKRYNPVDFVEARSRYRVNSLNSSNTIQPRPTTARLPDRRAVDVSTRHAIRRHLLPPAVVAGDRRSGGL